MGTVNAESVITQDTWTHSLFSTWAGRKNNYRPLAGSLLTRREWLSLAAGDRSGAERTAPWRFTNRK